MRSALLIASGVLTMVLAACGGSPSATTAGPTTSPTVVASSPTPSVAAATPTVTLTPMASPSPNPTMSPRPARAPTRCVIPQHGGGDGDRDNFGAPSDGDGCDR
jgi:hypothetical protein